MQEDLLPDVPKRYKGYNDNTDYIVYIHVFPNGKKYVGISRRPYERFGKNGKGYCKNSPMYQDIQKYGWGSIEHKVLQSNLSKLEARQLERRYIEAYDTIRNGYNTSQSGLSKQVLKEGDLTWTPVSATPTATLPTSVQTSKSGIGESGH